MHGTRLAPAACAAALVTICLQPVPARGDQAERLADHGSHSPLTSEERGLRELLARYDGGDVEGAVAGFLATPRDSRRKALDASLLRIGEHITYHRQPRNRVSAGRDEQLERFLRADRLEVLHLAAALHLDASRAVTAVDDVGSLVLESERAIDLLYALRGDFEENGPVPWPLRTDAPRARPSSVDWPAVRAFIGRWYPAAIARLQQLVELRLAPALLARGLARFPGHPDLLLARASFVETRLALSRVDASLAADLYPPDTRQRWRDELSEAERDLERALQAAGPASEAAMRLARVCLLRGEARRSRELLERVLAVDVPREIQYLALLLRAAAAEQAGNAQDATRDYRAALESIPGTQTPMLALARIADEWNQPADARAWIDRALAARSAPDPWRRYIQGQAWQFDARMAGLRDLEPR